MFRAVKPPSSDEDVPAPRPPPKRKRPSDRYVLFAVGDVLVGLARVTDAREYDRPDAEQLREMCMANRRAHNYRSGLIDDFDLPVEVVVLESWKLLRPFQIPTKLKSGHVIRSQNFADYDSLSLADGRLVVSLPGLASGCLLLRYHGSLPYLDKRLGEDAAWGFPVAGPSVAARMGLSVSAASLSAPSEHLGGVRGSCGELRQRRRRQ